MKTLSNLLSGYPVLEDLTVELREDLNGATNYKINTPSLKRLEIKFGSVYPKPRNYKFEIYGPALNHFRFSGDLSNLIFIEKLTKLVEVHISIYAGH